MLDTTPELSRLADLDARIEALVAEVASACERIEQVMSSSDPTDSIEEVESTNEAEARPPEAPPPLGGALQAQRPRTDLHRATMTSTEHESSPTAPLEARAIEPDSLARAAAARPASPSAQDGSEETAAPSLGQSVVETSVEAEVALRTGAGVSDSVGDGAPGTAGEAPTDAANSDRSIVVPASAEDANPADPASGGVPVPGDVPEPAAAEAIAGDTSNTDGVADESAAEPTAAEITPEANPEVGAGTNLEASEPLASASQTGKAEASEADVASAVEESPRSTREPEADASAEAPTPVASADEPSVKQARTLSNAKPSSSQGGGDSQREQAADSLDAELASLAENLLGGEEPTERSASALASEEDKAIAAIGASAAAAANATGSATISRPPAPTSSEGEARATPPEASQSTSARDAVAAKSERASKEQDGSSAEKPQQSEAKPAKVRRKIEGSRALRSVLTGISAPLLNKPKAVRQATGVVAAGTLVWAVLLWGKVMFFRKPPDPPAPKDPPTIKLEPTYAVSGWRADELAAKKAKAAGKPEAKKEEKKSAKKDDGH
ncbi:MAG: hypothetical protein SFZ23_06535 [Planctomycetota bacterium]|nr:hypothetical protein [Planctomycetota bacterium]